ncbi:MAG: S4 domain-containing protein [Opitutaceae bacterium]
MEPVRLQKFLADAGVCSRRAAEALIEAGEVSVNGKPAELGQRVTPGVDRVNVRGKFIGGGAALTAAKVTLLVHKPKGVVCGTPDGRHPETVFDLVPKEYARQRFLVAGRLDLESEGLVLLTSDGALADRIARGTEQVLRRMRVTLKQPFPKSRVAQLLKGVRVDEELVAAEEVFVLHPDASGASTELEVHVSHGRGRGLRELFTTIGCDVKRIQCAQIGLHKLGGMPLRGSRVLDTDDIEKLFRAE